MVCASRHLREGRHSSSDSSAKEIDKPWHDLTRRFVHQPMAGALDDHMLPPERIVPSASNSVRVHK